MARPRAAQSAPEDPQVTSPEALEPDAPEAQDGAAQSAPESAAGDQGEALAPAIDSPSPDVPEAEPAIAFVTMVRDAEDGGPTSAQVHPDEVENFAKGGWRPE